MFANSSTSTVNTESPKTLDLAAIEALLDSIPPDPLATWMRQQGFDPNKGGVLVLPPEMAVHLGPFTPHYIKLSKLTDVPVLVWALGMTPSPLDTIFKEAR